MTLPLWVPVLVPVFSGILAYALPEKLRKHIALTASLAQLVSCALIFAASMAQPQTLSLGAWNPPVGIMLYADRMAAVMILLTSFLFLMLTLF